MKVAIVHYHLRTGGVTRVVQHAMRALADSGDAQCVAIAASLPDDASDFAGTLIHEPALAYDGQRDDACDGSALADRLIAHATGALGGTPDIWHIHNHSLGKNLALTQAVGELAARGHRLVLQIHDFAEDGRPGNYAHLLKGIGDGDAATLNGQLYPQADHVHYAALNSRDHGFLFSSGLSPERVHLLPNAVAAVTPTDEPPPATDRPLYLYPTRAIRRKNLGELLLWAAADTAGAQYGATLAPDNPTALPVYERWVTFSEELGLPMAFEMGRDADFLQLVRSAYGLVSTSVAEGFGLAFLEPWLMGVPLFGRRLHEITSEFEDAGVDLSPLYDRLMVPLDWLDAGSLRTAVADTYRAFCADYGREPTADQLDAAWSSSLDGDRIDFGRLDEPHQEQVIRHVAGSTGARSELPALDPLPVASRESLVQSNAEAVRNTYGLAQYGERLSRLYEAALGSSVSPVATPPGLVLDAFMSPNRFCLLRTS